MPPLFSTGFNQAERVALKGTGFSPCIKRGFNPRNAAHRTVPILAISYCRKGEKPRT
jgi:hypothetical protein